jgi:small-conductance mechanosensitive channel
MNVNDALELIERTLTTAEEQAAELGELPPPIERTRRRLDAAFAAFDQAQASGDLHAQRDSALGILREYVTRVLAHADPEVPGSDDLTETLLHPLRSYD